MKNLPDEELFKELEGRLRNYEEGPDDRAWDKILQGIPHEDPAWIKWVDRSTLSVILFLMGLMLFMDLSDLNNTNDQVSHNAATRSVPRAPLADSAVYPVTHDDVRPASKDILNKKSSYRNEPAAGNDPIATTAKTGKLPDHGVIHQPEKGSSSTSIQKTSDEHNRAHQTASSTNSSGPANSPVDAELSAAPLTTRQRPHRRSTPSGQRSAKNDPHDVSVTERMIRPSVEKPVDLDIPSSRNEPSLIWMAVPDDPTLFFAAPAYPGGGPIAASASGGTNTIVRTKYKPRKSRSIYFVVTPSWSTYSARAATDDAVTITRLESSEALSKAHRALAIEGGVELQVYKRFSFMAGISYYHQANQITVAQAGSSGSTGQPSGDVSVVYIPKNSVHEIDYRMNNVGINSGLLYTIAMRRVSHRAGVCLQLLSGIGSRADGYDNAGVIYWSYRALYRLELDLNGGLAIFWQPSFTASLNDDELLNGTTLVRNRQFGIGFGIKKDL